MKKRGKKKGKTPKPSGFPALNVFPKPYRRRGEKILLPEWKKAKNEQVLGGFLATKKKKKKKKMRQLGGGGSPPPIKQGENRNFLTLGGKTLFFFPFYSFFFFYAPLKGPLKNMPHSLKNFLGF